jgi:hypothetical protein
MPLGTGRRSAPTREKPQWVSKFLPTNVNRTLMTAMQSFLLLLGVVADIMALNEK